MRFEIGDIKNVIIKNETTWDFDKQQTAYEMEIHFTIKGVKGNLIITADFTDEHDIVLLGMNGVDVLQQIKNETIHNKYENEKATFLIDYFTKRSKRIKKEITQHLIQGK